LLFFSIGFHLSHRLTEKFPESCLLIILGLIVGALLYITHLAEQKAYVLNSDTFFLFLLPVKIILHDFARCKLSMFSLYFDKELRIRLDDSLIKIYIL
jgi:hypothetical protein